MSNPGRGDYRNLPRGGPPGEEQSRRDRGRGRDDRDHERERERERDHGRDDRGRDDRGRDDRGRDDCGRDRNRDRDPRPPVLPIYGGAEVPGPYITSQGQERRDVPSADRYRPDNDQRRRPPPEGRYDQYRQDYVPGRTTDRYIPDNDRRRWPPLEDPHDPRRRDRVPADRYIPDNDRRRWPPLEDPHDPRRQDRVPADRYLPNYSQPQSFFNLFPREDRHQEGDNEQQRARPEDQDTRRRQEPRPIPPPAPRNQQQAKGRPPVKFPSDLPVIPSEGRPRVPPTSTIAPGHQPVYLVIFGNHDDQPGPNHWGFYIPYPKDGEVGTVISANVVLGKWKVQFSRNYMPDVSRRGLWFFYLGQVSQASVSDYSHLPGRTLFNDPDGELEEVTRAIPLPRSELKGRGETKSNCQWWLIEFVKELVKQNRLNSRVLDLFPKLPEDVMHPEKRGRR